MREAVSGANRRPEHNMAAGNWGWQGALQLLAASLV